jgi:3-phenylpropionate/trans-cinnamate dioxygenase ferredoxin subunit
MPRIEIPLETIPEDAPHRVEADGTGLVVVRTGEDVRAYHDVCPHAKWRLSDGEIVDGALECPGHGWQFSVKTGKCDTVPAYCLKPVSATVVGPALRLEWVEQDDTPVERKRTKHVEATL